ncbi:hypothetical protein BGX38DRAFT_243122 [Terfezia claveryi]|nr:hypothetical protein BGX38DRAFT_243122 [Terfezia claveryi]
MAFYNPFARHQQVTRANILWYRTLTIITWLLSFIPTIYYTYYTPHDNASPHHHYHHRHTTFGQSHAHPTPFTINHVFVSIYWIAMFIGQVGYVWHLFASNEVWVEAACSVGPHFILFNLLNFAHIMLWTRAHFILAEVALAINFLQLTSLYFRHSLPRPRTLHTTHRDSLNPRTEADYVSISSIKSIHIPTVSMPLAWTYFALFWNGAVMVRCHDAMVCRILANIVIWGIVPFAGTFLFAYGDWTMGLAIAFLTAGLGVGQFFMKTFALQWMFAFTIMAIVTLATFSLIAPMGSTTPTGERAPLLTEDA